MTIEEPRRQTIREDDKSGKTGAAPLASLTNNPYRFSSFNYPSDIENLSHAMLFNINVHESSNDLVTKREQLTEGEFKIDQSRQKRLTEGKIGLTRRYKRVKRAISLYVPDTLVFDDRQKYETPSLIEKLGLFVTGAATAASSAQDKIGNAGATAGSLGALLSGVVALGAATAPAGAGALAILGTGYAGLRAAQAFDRKFVTPAVRELTQLAGFAMNPVIEVLYSSPQLRKFNFDFVFAPRDQKEADLVWSIIYEFRRHSAPELFAGGLLFVPPSEFEITLLRKTSNGSFVENTNIPRMSTCVLENVQTDYASAGTFATFEDGMPIQIRMRLVFQELNIITRDAVDRGY